MSVMQYNITVQLQYDIYDKYGKYKYLKTLYLSIY